MAPFTPIGMHRNTVYRWLREGGAFRRMFDQVRLEIMQASCQLIESIAQEAALCVQGAILRGDGRLAFRLLERLGYFDGRVAGYPKDRS